MLRRGLSYTAMEIPVGKPQVKFFDLGNQWTPRGHVVRCQILSDAAIPPDLEEPFVSIDGRDFTLAELMTMVRSGVEPSRSWRCGSRWLK